MTMENIEKAARLIGERKIVVFTGAGVNTGTVHPRFSQPGGYGTILFDFLQSFVDGKIEKRWKFVVKCSNFADITQCHPLAIAELETMGKLLQLSHKI